MVLTYAVGVTRLLEIASERVRPSDSGGSGYLRHVGNTELPCSLGRRRERGRGERVAAGLDNIDLVYWPVGRSSSRRAAISVCDVYWPLSCNCSVALP